MNNKELLLVAFNQLEANSTPKSFEGAVKLVKAIFMAQSEGASKEVKSEDNFHYNFYRWDYGPFDSKIYRDISTLTDEGYVQVKYRGYEKCFELTDKGENEAKKLEVAVPSDIKTVFKKWMNHIKNMPKSQVLELVYREAKVSEYEMGDTITLPKL